MGIKRKEQSLAGYKWDLFKFLQQAGALHTVCHLIHFTMLAGSICDSHTGNWDGLGLGSHIRKLRSSWLLIWSRRLKDRLS